MFTQIKTRNPVTFAMRRDNKKTRPHKAKRGKGSYTRKRKTSKFEFFKMVLES